MRSAVSDLPKPMAPIGERPFLELLLDHLLKYDFDHIVLSTGYMHEKIESHFGSSYRGVPLAYAVEETPLGTGGGILNAFSQCESDDVVVLNGDTLFETNFDDLDRFYHSHDTQLAVVLRQVEDTSRYGSVVTDCCDRICQFTEKAASHGGGKINGGIYMMNRSIFDGYRVGDNFSFEKEIMQKRYTSDAYYAYVSGAYFIDIGIPEDYYRLIRTRGSSTP